MDGDEDSKVKGGGGGKGGLLLSEREETFFDLLSTIKRSWWRHKGGKQQIAQYKQVIRHLKGSEADDNMEPVIVPSSFCRRC